MKLVLICYRLPKECLHTCSIQKNGTERENKTIPYRWQSFICCPKLWQFFSQNCGFVKKPTHYGTVIVELDF